jgi:hypothetical protein
VIRLTKFSKSRLVPFGPRLAGLLRQYLEALISAAFNLDRALSGRAD